MTTVVNSPAQSDSGAGIIIGTIIALLVIGAFFIYGLPALQGRDVAPAKDTTINVQLPAPIVDSIKPSPGQ